MRGENNSNWKGGNVKLNCEQCGKEFEVRPSHTAQRFCSKPCHGLWASENRHGENHPAWKEKIKIVCNGCGKVFEVIPSEAGRRFCSIKCAAVSRLARPVRKIKRFCQQCGKEFAVWPYEIKNGGGKYCSRECRRIRAKIKCLYCDQEFETWLSRIKAGKKFCSKDCYSKWQSTSETNKGSSSPVWKGGKVKLICKWCGREFEAGRSLINTAKFCSTKCVNLWRSENWCGENSPTWKGGLSFEPYGLEWIEDLKEDIRRRDNYTCAISGDVWEPGQPTFHVHHIDYNKKNSNPMNLITLEPSSHIKTNFDRDLWQAILEPIAQARERKKVTV